MISRRNSVNILGPPALKTDEVRLGSSSRPCFGRRPLRNFRRAHMCSLSVAEKRVLTL